LILAVPLLAQDDSLSLREAARLALRENKAIAGANAAVRAAETGVDEARSGRLPKLNYSESVVRNDNPNLRNAWAREGNGRRAARRAAKTRVLG
jgi:outer membrane protein TolC